MALSAELNIEIGGFVSGIKQGQQVLKGLNAEMKASEAEFKATGNAEQKLTSQTNTLNSQIRVQKGVADQARQALDAMTKAGIKPADQEYQKLYVTLMNAEAGANEAQAALNQLGSGAAQAATGADKMANSLGNISKKLSLDQVISGINTITGGLESAAKKAYDLGEQIWNQMMDKAKWADDTATMAQMYGIDVDTFQRMQKLVTNGLDTTVEAMLKSQQKLNKGVGEESKNVMETLQQLGLAITSGKDEMAHLITEDQTQLFWQAGQAIMGMADAAEQEAAAQALFGRSWHELVPLFKEYKTVEEYNKALEDTYVVSEEGVSQLAELNDKYNELKGNFDTLSTEIMAQLAPALTEAADALNGMLTSLLEYLKTDEGKQMLTDLGTAVSGLFDNLSDIDPETVVEGFTGVMDKIIKGVEWVVDNKDAVIGALEAIVVGWGALKITGAALDIVKLFEGIAGLAGGGATAAGAAAGASWGGAFASAVAAAAPWLIGLYTMLNPAGTAGNNMDLVWNGGLTEGGLEFIRNNPEQWNERLLNVGNRYGDLATLLGSPEALNIISNITLNEEEIYQQLEEQLGLTPVDVPAEPEVPEGAAEDIAAQIGVVHVDVVGDVVQIGDRLGRQGHLPGHANGLPYVPYDGYLARLHKGERVVPAREVNSQSYNSNLYVESMYMNGGIDANGLASAMAAAQKRTMSGYGS